MVRRKGFIVIPDPIWGPIVTEAWVERLLESPEVQRLGHIRLLNSSPSSLPALGDVHRLTHTIGVLGLATSVAGRLADSLSPDELRAFVAAAILHDVGTPPFGHSFEYLLKATTGWDHERMLERLLEGDYRPEGRYAQIFHGKQLTLRPLLEQLRIREDLVVECAHGSGKLGALISGSLDLDNIDNVYRMGSFLGLRPDLDNGRNIVEAITPAGHGVAWDRSAVDSINRWADLRERTYSVLAFDTSNLQYQCMLSHLLRAAFADGILGEEHWSWTDESLLYRLESRDRTRSIARRLLAGPRYVPIFIGWYGETTLPVDDLRAPTRAEELRESLEERLRVKVSPYIHYDTGMFRKRIVVRVRDGASVAEEVITTTQSASTIACVFAVASQPHIAQLRQHELAMEVLEKYGLSAATLRRIPTKRDFYDFPGQEELPI